jgi:hypothetical protein
VNGRSDEKIPYQVENPLSILSILRALFQNWGLTKRVQQLKQVGFLFHPACPAAEAVSGSYMLSTGVRNIYVAPFRDTHGSLFQDLDGRTAFLTALQKQAFSNRCTFAANMLPAAIPCPLPTEKKDSRSWFSKRSFHHLAF